ncbi:mycothiol transferase [Micromonospora lutea]|uniref:mycothiol transferase n=1 Tax=Micromonospora lutea TaxID=419825 RepID=UPI001EF1892A|nr:DUF664 domain-containing protein [Micromonospora lutea]
MPQWPEPGVDRGGTLACFGHGFPPDHRRRRARPAVAGPVRGVPRRASRRGPLPLRWIYLHVLREFAQHCGHADILREQILSE